jgi:hypothetical protein
MTFDTNTEEEIKRILRAYLRKDPIKSVDTSATGCLELYIKNLSEYSDTKVIPMTEVQDYNRNLAEACSSLSTLCDHRGLLALFDTENSRFIFTDWSRTNRLAQNKN